MPAPNPYISGGNRLYRPWQSQAPVAMNALVALLKNQTATMTGDDVPVIHFGPFMGEASDNNIIAIGWTGFVPGYQYPSRFMSEELYGAALQSQVVEAGLGPSSTEMFEITNASLVRSGSTKEGDRQAAVGLAYANLQLVGNVIAQPPWLSGTVAHAEFASPVNMHMVQDRRGFLAIVGFSIRCTAWAQQ